MTDSQAPTPDGAAKALSDFLNRIWSDDAFRARLESDPKALLAEIGAQVPADLDVRVVCDTDTVKYLHIPSPPPEGEISDQDLVGAQGGHDVRVYHTRRGGERRYHRVYGHRHLRPNEIAGATALYSWRK